MIGQQFRTEFIGLKCQNQKTTYRQTPATLMEMDAELKMGVDSLPNSVRILLGQY
ncbi:MAG: hypothetical protein [Olavius algarvensis Delta 4 endosymbiont]|nr:MAG: hypothetical protein [Olavius algarvensis Delta 4 endosymbiont]